MSSHWTKGFFGSLYAELYRRYLLDPERTREEAEFAASCLELKQKRVLDLAAGFGRHARLLARNNRVVALDQNRHYLEIARRGVRGRTRSNLFPIHGDMRHLPFADEAFDAVLLLFNSFGYFAPPATSSTHGAPLPQIFRDSRLLPEEFRVWQIGGRNGQPPASPACGIQRSCDPHSLLLEEVFRVLRPGGGLLLEVPNPDPLVAAVRESPRRHQVTAHYEIEEEFSFDPQRCILNNRTRFRLGRREEGGEYQLRLYRHSEIRQLLENASLRVKKVYGGYEGQRFRVRSSEMLLVHALRAPATKDSKARKHS